MAIYRVTIGGVLLGSQRWSVGFSGNPMGVPSAPTPTDLSALAVQLFTDFVSSAWSASGGGTSALSSLVGTQGNLDQVRVYYYPNGSAPAESVGVSNQAAVAGTSTISKPPQVALVASLLTGLAGRSYRGRVYWPCVTQSITADGRVPTTLASGVATSTANFLSLMRTRQVAGQFVIPVVDSSTGADAPITQVRVDNVFDTQRRRRDKVTATASGVANLIVG